MAESFLEVAQQVLILFVLVAVGFVCGKGKLFQESAAKGITNFVLTIVVPCVIVQSFQRPFDPGMLAGLGIAAAAAVAAHLLGILLAHLTLRDRNRARERVLRFSVVFSNAGFMAIPLQQALLGEDGVFYGAAYIAVFNMVLWSYGLVSMSGNKEDISPKKLLLNPGLLSVAVGLAFFLGSITLPEVLAVPVGHLAALNTPLPMVIVGFYLADARLLSALKDGKVYWSLFLRLIVVPLLTLGGLLLCGVRDVLLISIVIAASAPVAAAATMFSAKFGQDVELSVNLVSLSTLLSIATMPLVVSLAQLGA